MCISSTLERPTDKDHTVSIHCSLYYWAADTYCRRWLSFVLWRRLGLGGSRSLHCALFTLGGFFRSLVFNGNRCRMVVDFVNVRSERRSFPCIQFVFVEIGGRFPKHLSFFGYHQSPDVAKWHHKQQMHRESGLHACTPRSARLKTDGYHEYVYSRLIVYIYCIYTYIDECFAMRTVTGGWHVNFEWCADITFCNGFAIGVGVHALMVGCMHGCLPSPACPALPACSSCLPACKDDVSSVVWWKVVLRNVM